MINPNYALFMGGSFVSATGSWAQAVAIGWLITEQSTSAGNAAFLLGLASFASMIPLLFFGFPAGALVDRVNRRTLLMIAQIGSTLIMSLLAVAAYFNMATVPLILALSVVGGLFNALGWPTWSVFIKDLVGPEHLRSAIALNTARFNLSRVIGPAIAGVILATWGSAACLAIAAISGFGVIFTLLAIKVPALPTRPREPWLQSLREGLAYAYREPVVRQLLMLTGVIGFLGMPYQAFLPTIARDSLSVGPEGLGLLLTSVGVGALGGAAISGSSFASKNHYRTLGAFAALTGIGIIGMALSRQIEFAMLALSLVGLASVGYLAVANATLQLAVRDDLVGRVMGLWTVLNAGVMPLGSLTIGATAQSIGLSQSLITVGAVCALIGLAVFLRSQGSIRAEALASLQSQTQHQRGDN